MADRGRRDVGLLIGICIDKVRFTGLKAHAAFAKRSPDLDRAKNSLLFAIFVLTLFLIVVIVIPAAVAIKRTHSESDAFAVVKNPVEEFRKLLIGGGTLQAFAVLWRQVREHLQVSIP